MAINGLSINNLMKPQSGRSTQVAPRMNKPEDDSKSMSPSSTELLAAMVNELNVVTQALLNATETYKDASNLNSHS